MFATLGYTSSSVSIYTIEVSLLLHSRLIFIIWREWKISNFNHNLAPILSMFKGWAFEHPRHPNMQVTNINSTLSSLTTEVTLLSWPELCFASCEIDLHHLMWTENFKFQSNLAPIFLNPKGWAFEHRRSPNMQVTNNYSTLSSLTTEVTLLSLTLACLRDWFSSFDVNGKLRIQCSSHTSHAQRVSIWAL